jgi:hypothetical protein
MPVFWAGGQTTARNCMESELRIRIVCVWTRLKICRIIGELVRPLRGNELGMLIFEGSLRSLPEAAQESRNGWIDHSAGCRDPRFAEQFR